MLQAITEALAAGEAVQITGFGTFEVRSCAAHIARNPHTGERVHIPAKKRPAFKPGKALKTAVAQEQNPDERSVES